MNKNCYSFSESEKKLSVCKMLLVGKLVRIEGTQRPLLVVQDKATTVNETAKPAAPCDGRRDPSQLKGYKLRRKAYILQTFTRNLYQLMNERDLSRTLNNIQSINQEDIPKNKKQHVREMACRRGICNVFRVLLNHLFY